MTPAVALRLGRVSNLPTVWTNALAGVVLAGVPPWQAGTLLVALGLSLAYVGGMYLNDAFDREIDAREKPGRPIPSGAVVANTVFAAGFAMLLAGAGVMVAAARAFGVAPDAAVLAALLLGGAIIAYNVDHKGNALSPVAMGSCRVLAYLTAGLAATAGLTLPLIVGAIVSLSWLIGLTYTAKQESLGRIETAWPLLFLGAPLGYGLVLAGVAGPSVLIPLVALAALTAAALWLLRRRAAGDIPRAVVSLIAGIALLDAMLLTAAGAPDAAMVAVVCFIATLAMQRWISGT